MVMFHNFDPYFASVPVAIPNPNACAKFDPSISYGQEGPVTARVAILVCGHTFSIRRINLRSFVKLSKTNQEVVIKRPLTDYARADEQMHKLITDMSGGNNSEFNRARVIMLANL